MAKKEEKSLSIRLKVTMMVIFFALAFSVFIYFISSQILLKSYLYLEERDKREDIRRAEDALANTIEQLDIKLIDWAFWDDTYQYIEDRNEAYVESNLTSSSLATLKINGMVFVNTAGEVVFKQMINFETQAELPTENVVAHILAHRELTVHESKTSPVKGLISLPEGPAYVASEPILTSQGDGPIRGSLIFIKFLSAEEVTDLGALTHLNVTAFPYESNAVPPDVQVAKNVIGPGDTEFVKPLSNSVIAGYTVLRDLYGAPLLLLRVESDRPIYHQGRKTFTVYGLIMGGVAPLFGLLVLIALQRLVFSRLTKLNQELEEIGTSGVSGRVTEEAGDELGELQMSINLMLAQLAKSETDLEKFKLAVESVDEHVIITDPTGHILYANASAEKITGYAQEEMLGKTPSVWGGQMPATYYIKMWKTIAKDKRTFTGEVQNKRKNGELYLASVIISPILDEHRNVQFFVGIEQDITTERKAAEDRERYAGELKAAKEHVEEEVKKKTRELQEERARFLASVNSLQIGFTIVDVKGTLLLKNPALPKILNSKEDPQTLEDVTRLLGGEIDLEQKLKDCTEKRCAVDIAEMQLDRKFLRVFITPVFTDETNGRSLGGVLLIEDITEAKAIEKAKTEFVSLASHQLRTPLSSVNWYIEMLLGGDAGKLTKNQKSYLEEIGNGNRRMVALVNALLDVSRLDLGHLAIRVAPTDVRYVMAQIVQSQHEKAHEQKLKVTETYDDVPLVPIDERYFRMVGENLLANALKYTPEKGTVDVRVKKLEAGDTFGGRKMEEPTFGLAVADTGYGIPEAQQKKVFEKLFRADNVLDKDEPGTGLGLYIVKAIVDQSGGSIWFESKENIGTTFYVTFPMTGMKPQDGTRMLT